MRESSRDIAADAWNMAIGLGILKPGQPLRAAVVDKVLSVSPWRAELQEGWGNEARYIHAQQQGNCIEQLAYEALYFDLRFLMALAKLLDKAYPHDPNADSPTPDCVCVAELCATMVCDALVLRGHPNYLSKYVNARKEYLDGI